MNVKKIAIANPDILKVKATHRALLVLASNLSKKSSVTIYTALNTTYFYE
ncbi:hypothetical protein [Microcoleus sp. EPA2]